jgi:hypothetical protein
LLAIWKTRNNSCFERKILKNPVDLIYLATSFMKYWAGTHLESEAAQLQQGAHALLNLALGAGGAGDGENAKVAGAQLLIEQGVDAMETDVQDDVAADDKMQT